MNDIAERLRDPAVFNRAVMREAASEIERLERLAEWRAGLVAAGVDLLREIRVLCDQVDTDTHEPLQQSLVDSIYNVLDGNTSMHEGTSDA